MFHDDLPMRAGEETEKKATVTNFDRVHYEWQKQNKEVAWCDEPTVIHLMHVIHMNFLFYLRIFH